MKVRSVRARRSMSALFVALGALTLGACNGPDAAAPPRRLGQTGSSAQPSSQAPLIGRAGAPPSEDAHANSATSPAAPPNAGTASPGHAATTSDDDGAPTRQACTSDFGSDLSGKFGRMDGYLVSIVPPRSSHACNGDPSHVHLQVLLQGSVYDVAVNVDGLSIERDIPLPGAPWSEGWHTDASLDYTDLGLHSPDFIGPDSADQLAQKVESELATTNHISVFATGYNSSGAHLVHRGNQGGHDGAIVLHPTAAIAHALFFAFDDSPTF